MDARFDILGIGNAIVDVVAPCDHAFLSKHGMHPGTMRLIDAHAAETLYAAMPPGTESSGGSAANTCAVASGLGARVAFQGKVAQDQLGEVFRHDIRAAGAHFPTAPLIGGAPTARCLILVTPDGQRTMNTFLGACVMFDESDLLIDDIEAAKVTYLEGYLFDPPYAQKPSSAPHVPPMPPAARWHSHCRIHSASTVTAPRSCRCSRMWIFFSPTKRKSAACTKRRISVTPWWPRAAT